VDVDLEIDTLTIDLQDGDEVILCSDGLTGPVDDEQIRDVLVAEEGVIAAAEALVELANEHGGPDNISVVLLRYEADPAEQRSIPPTVIRTDRVAAPGPNGADLWWSGKHKHHGGNVQVISTPDGWPIWVSPVRPGREHDTTCARHHGLIDALNRLADQLGTLTLVDLGYENAGDGFRHPVKKPAGGQLTEDQQTFNKVIRGIHGVCERANSLLKVTFKALRRVSLDPGRITQIAAAALVLLQLEYDRTI
jgi:hypothetical protein